MVCLYCSWFDSLIHFVISYMFVNFDRKSVINELPIANKNHSKLKEQNNEFRCYSAINKCLMILAIYIF